MRSRIANFTSPRGFVSVLPFLGEYVRVFAVDFAKQDRAADEELTLAELQDTVDAVAPVKLELREPRWLTRFRSPSRQVPRNRVGRIFLAGDAAHAHSPAGGQGMNMGIQDAFNLAWKLGMVLRGDAPEALLDSYQAERHPVDARIRRGTDLMFRTFLLRNPALKAARDLLARALVSFPPVEARLAADLSGIGIDYRFTAQSRAARRPSLPRRRGLPRGAVRAGDRVPDVELWDVAQPSVRLYEVLRGLGYALFAFASAARLRDDRELLATLVDSVRKGFGDSVRTHVVLDEGLPQAVGTPAPTLVDFKGQFRGKLGAAHRSVLLVRPDGHLVFHLRGFDPPTVSAGLRPWAGRPRPAR